MDSFTIASISLAAGGLLGAANAVFGMIKDSEVFDTRKFAITVVTGIIAGVALVFSQISGLLEVQTATDLLLQLVGLALMIFGANFIRTTISGAIANKATQESTPTTP